MWAGGPPNPTQPMRPHSSASSRRFGGGIAAGLYGLPGMAGRAGAQIGASIGRSSSA